MFAKRNVTLFQQAAISPPLSEHIF